MDQTKGKALVVGAGIGGIRSALDLAENGHSVTLIDASPHMGGILSRLDYQFPSDGCGMCRMLPLVERDQSAQFCLRRGLFHDNIDLMLSTTLEALDGDPGQYTARLKQKRKSIDPDLCNGCGRCSEVCPVDISDAFNLNMGTKKAVHLPLPHALPNIYTIDTAACTLCGACEPVCPTGAINLPRDTREKFRILVVDDELIVRDSMKEWFAFEGYTVEMADSGAAALEMLEQQSFHLMCLDIKLGPMDGTEVLASVAGTYPDMNVVMMTAYATVETAVKTLKQGAMEYIVKPFEPDAVIALAERLYQEIKPAEETEISLETGAVVLSCGTASYQPGTGKNTFGHGIWPDVVTGPEYERIISGTGPTGGRLVRPSTGSPPKRIAWIQCVGSRSLQDDASDFCSSICCMHALKEAVLTREKSNSTIETVIYYMDMRCPGKTFEAYKEKAVAEHGVILKRARPHTVRWDEARQKLCLYISDNTAHKTDEDFDMVVLSVGVCPRPETAQLCAMGDLPLNDEGFPALSVAENAITDTGAAGVFPGGSFAGPMDIHDTLIHASAAAWRSITLLNNTPGKTTGTTSEDALNPDTGNVDAQTAFRDVSMERPVTLLILCQCGANDKTVGKNRRINGDTVGNGNTIAVTASNDTAVRYTATAFQNHPQVCRCITAETLCTRKGWEKLLNDIPESGFNRVVIGACLPHLFKDKIKVLSRQTALHPHYFDVVDIFNLSVEDAQSRVSMALSGIRHATPMEAVPRTVEKTALVMGAGIAGMTAALALAENQARVVLVEKEPRTGGNLNWLKTDITGRDFTALVRQTNDAVAAHPRITLMTGATLVDSFGHVGNFVTTIAPETGNAVVVHHGTTILATGGTEAVTRSMGHGSHPDIMTLKVLETSLGDNTLSPADKNCVIMIQCVDCRDEHKEYCSRICCTSALKHALALKKANPDLQLFILYRDMMTYGFSESYYKQAREMGILFIRYTLASKPAVQVKEEGLTVTVHEPILDRPVEISPDLVVLSTGVVPTPAAPQGASPADRLGIALDDYGFFRQADDKFRPVDSLRQGVFACGMALGPRSVEESMLSARAAAVRALAILKKPLLKPATITAGVKPTLCSLCELCIGACPYEARQLNAEQNAVEVDAVLCQGCGTCAAVCPASASFLNGYRDHQMLDIIDAALYT